MKDVLREYTARWEQIVQAYLRGRREPPPELRGWFESYRGTGSSAPDLSGFTEPYIGGLQTAPRMVVLGLNPGRTFPHLQAPDGLFAEEIRELGTYEAWAASSPYLRYPWLHEGPNVFHRARVNFMRRWYDEPTLHSSSLLIVEAYPWHSRTFDKNRYRPDPGIVRDWVWSPVAATGAPVVFAFGSWWYDEMPTWPGMTVAVRLGRGGRDYGGNATRAVLVLSPDVGPPVVVEKHPGSAGPPSEAETHLLREALAAEGV